MSTEATEEKKEEEGQETTDFDTSSITEEDIDKLGEEDLDNLMTQMESEAGETEEGGEEGAGAQEQAGEASTEEAGKNGDGEQTAATEKAPEGEQPSGEGETVESLKAERDKMLSHQEEQRVFNERQGTEVGQLRSQLQILQQQAVNRQGNAPGREMSEAEQTRLNELADKDPIAFNREMKQLDDAAAENARLQSETEFGTMIMQHNQQIAHIVPDWEKSRDDVEKYLGEFIAPEAARAFAGNPASDRNGPMFLKVATDVVVERAKTVAVQTKLDAANEKLKTVSEKINAAAGKKRTMGNLGSETHTDPKAFEGVTEADIEKMSEKQLVEFLAQKEKEAIANG